MSDNFSNNESLFSTRISPFVQTRNSIVESSLVLPVVPILTPAPTSTSNNTSVPEPNPRNLKPHSHFKKKHYHRPYIVFNSLKVLYKHYKHKIDTINRCGIILYYDNDYACINSTAVSKKRKAPPTATPIAKDNNKTIDQDPGIVKKSRTFLFAVDRRTRELTDMGGGISESDTSLISTAIRETREESLGIFDELLTTTDKFDDHKIYERAWAITDFKTLIIFWKIQPIDSLEKSKINIEFKKRASCVKHPEVIGLEWISTDQFELLLSRPSKPSRSPRPSRPSRSASASASSFVSKKPRRASTSSFTPIDDKNVTNPKLSKESLLVAGSDSPIFPVGYIRVYDKVLKLLRGADTTFDQLP